MANVQENIILHYKTFYFGTFYFGKTCADTWNFSLPKKLDWKKQTFFTFGPSLWGIIVNFFSSVAYVWVRVVGVD
jgi:hypothetical protein